jgi:hypothetical protein
MAESMFRAVATRRNVLKRGLLGGSLFSLTPALGGERAWAREPETFGGVAVRARTVPIPRPLRRGLRAARAEFATRGFSVHFTDASEVTLTAGHDVTRVIQVRAVADHSDGRRAFIGGDLLPGGVTRVEGGITTWAGKKVVAVDGFLWDGERFDEVGSVSAAVRDGAVVAIAAPRPGFGPELLVPLQTLVETTHDLSRVAVPDEIEGCIPCGMCVAWARFLETAACGVFGGFVCWAYCVATTIACFLCALAGAYLCSQYWSSTQDMACAACRSSNFCYQADCQC